MHEPVAILAAARLAEAGIVAKLIRAAANVPHMASSFVMPWACGEPGGQLCRASHPTHCRYMLLSFVAVPAATWRMWCYACMQLSSSLLACKSVTVSYRGNAGATWLAWEMAGRSAGRGWCAPRRPWQRALMHLRRAAAGACPRKCPCHAATHLFLADMCKHEPGC